MNKKQKEWMAYLIFGVLTTVVSVAVFAVLTIFLSMNELAANGIAWVASVSFAYFTNRIWVFKAPTKNSREFCMQMLSFYGSRVFTLLCEDGMLFVGISCMHFPDMWVKLIAQLVIVVLNYLISKKIVFHHGE